MKLSSFFNFFKPNKPNLLNINTNEFIPGYWEDDFCQVEIVPSENWEFIARQSQGISNLAEKSKNGLGFSDTFERSSMPVPTLSKEIRADYLEHFLSGFEIPKAKYIKYEASKIINCENSITKAYGHSYFTIFFETDGELVKNIWISAALLSSIDQFDPISSILHGLGQENELILIDWNSLELIDLRDRKQIQKYLGGYSK